MMMMMVMMMMALINSTSFWSLSSLLLVVLRLTIHVSDYPVNGQPLVPAMFIFGDSVMDAGNNNNLLTAVKADFLPYGRDFLTHQPTGRFCNGKLAADLIADSIGFTSYQPAYLSKEAKGKNLLIGANFASASSGYYEPTAKLYGAVSLKHQLGHFEEYKMKLTAIVGISNTSSIISESVYLLSAGSSDFLQNYHINPFLYEIHSPQQFAHILIKNFCDFIQKLYDMGARKIGVTSLPPLGCAPAAITIFGHHHSNDCVDKLNKDAIMFNNKLNATAQRLQRQLHNLTLVVFDIYHPLYQLISNPQDNGFAEARKACCGTGLLETSFLCNSKSPGTCKNATEYVFWDGFHPTEAANQIVSDSLIAEGISLIS